jgi:cell division protein FtsB
MAIGFNLETESDRFDEGYAAAKREYQSEIDSLKEENEKLKKKLEKLKKK